MYGQKAILPHAIMYHSTYAFVGLKGEDFEGHVVGWVLTHDDKSKFAAKLDELNRREGFRPGRDPSLNCYQRGEVEVILQEEIEGPKGAPIADPGTVIKAYVFHKTSFTKTMLENIVPDGDWFKRDSSWGD